jgi:Rps23 Pro-64 3,4-dihydroxylase Tpa1-like proline 4-hydroxylase
VAHLHLVPLTGRNDGELCALAIEDQRMRKLLVVQTEIQQAQLAVRKARIDDQQIEWRAAVFDQVQKLLEALHRRHAKVIELVEQPLYFHPVEVLFVGDQDA